MSLVSPCPGGNGCCMRKNKVRSTVVEHRSRANRKTRTEATRRIGTRFSPCSLRACRNNLLYPGRCSYCAVLRRRQEPGSTGKGQCLTSVPQGQVKRPKAE